MPAAAVIRRWQALSGIGRVGGFKSDVKAAQPWRVINWKLERCRRGSGIPCVAVKCAEIWRNTSGEATFWSVTDADVRVGIETGLDTLVVHAVNDEC